MSKAKISIRFFNDREVRAVWDEENAKWMFSVLDIVALLTDQNDYAKTRNYWKYLKAKLKKENSEVVSATTQFKFWLQGNCSACEIITCSLCSVFGIIVATNTYRS
ncbi:MAG: hypothetical protein ABI207_06375, partial [Crocinitomicaceae bacterium]